MGVAMKLQGHWKQIQSLSWSRCGRYLLTASQDCRATLWDLKTQERIRTAKFEAPIYTAELHPYNHFLFVVSLFEDSPFLVDINAPIAIKHRIPTTPLSDNILPSRSQTSHYLCHLVHHRRTPHHRHIQRLHQHPRSLHPHNPPLLQT